MTALHSRDWRVRLGRAVPYLLSLLAIGLSVGLATALDAFRASDGFAHDVLTTIAADADADADAGEDAATLVVEMPPDQPGLWDAVISRAVGAGALAIGLVDPPEGVALPAGAPVLVGRTLPQEGTEDLALLVPGLDRRILRRHAVAADGRPTLAAALARAAGAPVPRPETTEGPGGVYIVSYGRVPSALARLGGGQVASGGAADALLRDRVVLVGTARQGQPVLPLPLLDTPGVDPVVFQAYAAATLMTGSAPLVAGGWIAGLLVLVTAGVVAVIELAVFRLTGPLAGVASGAVLVVAVVGAFLLAGVLLPVTGMALGAMGAAVFTIWRRSRTRETTMRQLTLSLLSGTRENLFERNARSDQQRWDEIAVFVMQLLDLERLVVLVAEPGRPFVRERTAVNCGIEDIEEMRRDYRRSPYSDALEADTLIRSPRRFLRPAVEKGEVEYIAPLRFAGEVQGFWAMSVTPDKATRLDDQRGLVGSIAGRIAERLYRSRAQGTGGRIGIAGPTVEDRLVTAAWYGQARQRMLQEIADASASATIAFDLFGNVLHVNRGMSRILEEAGIAAFSMTAVDFLGAATGIDRTEARRRICVVVGEGGEDVMLSSLGDGRRVFLVSLRPVGAPWTQQVGDRVEMDPVKGLLCEFSDVTSLAANAATRQQFAAFVSESLNNDLQALTLAVHLLRGPQQAAAERHIREVVARMGARLASAREALEAGERRAISGAAIPFAMRRLLDDVLADPGAAMRIEPQLALSSGLACGDAAGVRDGLRAVLALLAEDAGTGSVGLGYRETVEDHVVEAWSRGPGMPVGRLRAILEGREAPEEAAWRAVADFAAAVRRWGGRVSGSAAPGEGLSIRIALARTDLVGMMCRLPTPDGGRPDQPGGQG